MSARLTTEYDGRYTLTYTTSEGERSGARVLPEAGRIFAAAPELLAACEATEAAVSRWVECGCYDGGSQCERCHADFDAALVLRRAALARARGER